MFYENVFRALNERKVKYLVIGGIALNLHGIPRATADLDLMLELTEDNLKKVADALEELNFKPKVHADFSDFCDLEKLREFEKEKNMLVFSFWNKEKPYEEVDILIKNPISFEEAYREREIIKAKGIEIPVISAKHLIKLKELSGRAQDKSDIEALKKVERIKSEEYEKI